MQWLIILCQYLVLKPLTTLTASSLFVILEARTSNNSRGISLQHFLTDSVNSSMLVGKSFSTSRFKDAQRFPIGLRFGEYFGKLKRISLHYHRASLEQRRHCGLDCCPGADSTLDRAKSGGH